MNDQNAIPAYTSLMKYRTYIKICSRLPRWFSGFFGDVHSAVDITVITNTLEAAIAVRQADLRVRSMFLAPSFSKG